MGVIVVGVFPSILNIFHTNPNKVEPITFRVTEISGISVPKAKVILLSGNDIHIQYTDSSGVGTFSLIKEETLRVFVETDQYEIYDQIFSANTPNPIEIRLNPKDVSKKSVIIRIIDNKDDIPINGAEVILIVNGSIYSQNTDSNGITKFTTAFPTDEIDGDISVSVSGFKAEHQRVTLQADRVQDIRLDKTSGTLTVGFTGEGKEVARTPAVNNETTNSDGNNVSQEDMCNQLKLTPEECSIAGTHEYTSIGTVTTKDCTWQGGSKTRTETYTETFIFLQDGTLLIGEAIYNKIGVNTYTYTDTDSIATWLSTLVISTKSYTEDSKALNNFENTCDTHFEVSQIK